MDYSPFHSNINLSEYDCIISLGNKCPTATIMKELNMRTESFPFDYIPTTPALILKYLKEPELFYPKKNQICNNDGVWFGHFNTSDKYEETVNTFCRRFERFYQVLKDHKKILFIYSSEADIYNELGNKYNDNYKGLCNIKDYIKSYNLTNFKIVAIHTNKWFDDSENISNYTIIVPECYSTHDDVTTSEYRRVLKILMKKIFNI